jgi:hypothetical protein
MSLHVLASIVFLVVVLFVVPAVIIVRDLRNGRPDPTWTKDGRA